MPDRHRPFPDCGVATCAHCGQLHAVEYHHDGRFGEGPIYGMWSLSCSVPWLRDDGTAYEVEFITREALWGLA